MKTSDAGRKFIATWEGCRLEPYTDTAGWRTVGAGHRIRPGEDLDRPITAAEADALLATDLAEAEGAVAAAVTGAILTQPEFDACVSLAFNVGANAFAGSTLVRYLNAGDHLSAAMQFEVWSIAGPGRSKGLLRRRLAEAALFLS